MNYGGPHVWFAWYPVPLYRHLKTGHWERDGYRWAWLKDVLRMPRMEGGYLHTDQTEFVNITRARNL